MFVYVVSQGNPFLKSKFLPYIYVEFTALPLLTTGYAVNTTYIHVVYKQYISSRIYLSLGGVYSLITQIDHDFAKCSMDVSAVQWKG